MLKRNEKKLRQKVEALNDFIEKVYKISTYLIY